MVYKYSYEFCRQVILHGIHFFGIWYRNVITSFEDKSYCMTSIFLAFGGNVITSFVHKSYCMTSIFSAFAVEMLLQVLKTLITA